MLRRYTPRNDVDVFFAFCVCGGRQIVRHGDAQIQRVAHKVDDVCCRVCQQSGDARFVPRRDRFRPPTLVDDVFHFLDHAGVRQIHNVFRHFAGQLVAAAVIQHGAQLACHFFGRAGGHFPLRQRARGFRSCGQNFLLNGGVRRQHFAEHELIGVCRTFQHALGQFFHLLRARRPQLARRERLFGVQRFADAAFLQNLERVLLPVRPFFGGLLDVAERHLAPPRLVDTFARRVRQFRHHFFDVVGRVDAREIDINVFAVDGFGCF